MKTLGIIAGRGRLPVIAAAEARRRGKKVVVSAIAEAKARFPHSAAEAVRSISLGQAGATIEFFREEGVDHVALLGKVDKQLSFTDMEFDEVALAMLSRLAGRADMRIAGVVLDELESRGFHVAEQTEFLGELLAPEGAVAGAESMTEAQKADVDMGVAVASDLVRHDVGQTVVVREGAVIAVEAFEHTDATIRRAGKLAGDDLVVVKLARPKQDFRFDVPTVGVGTLRVMHKAGAKVLAVEAGKTLMIDPKGFAAKADELGIAVVGVRRA
ncbi:MAG: UDP-2,3-diacylglucosamine diphosphatase LpxI [Deltaproteobacteria bacterium]|nr:UDP-2,3-diacylglucosamine diphosphatase LpxI [Deltaproteobacteria bacterium]MCB9487449.1 UDP-2,3-diacylglucosamine diphosphatase LpxI [Deltaproteobacteria bacterium]